MCVYWRQISFGLYMQASIFCTVVNSMGYLENNKHKQIRVVEDMVFPGVIKK